MKNLPNVLTKQRKLFYTIVIQSHLYTDYNCHYLVLKIELNTKIKYIIWLNNNG